MFFKLYRLFKLTNTRTIFVYMQNDKCHHNYFFESADRGKYILSQNNFPPFRVDIAPFPPV